MNKFIGSWIIDREQGTATQGDLTVTIVSDGDQGFSVNYAGARSAEARAAIEEEVLSVFEHAHVLVERQSG